MPNQVLGENPGATPSDVSMSPRQPASQDRYDTDKSTRSRRLHIRVRFALNAKENGFAVATALERQSSETCHDLGVGIARLESSNNERTFRKA